MVTLRDMFGDVLIDVCMLFEVLLSANCLNRVEGVYVELLKIRCMLSRGVREDERLEGFKAGRNAIIFIAI